MKRNILRFDRNNFRVCFGTLLYGSFIKRINKLKTNFWILCTFLICWSSLSFPSDKTKHIIKQIWQIRTSLTFAIFFQGNQFIEIGWALLNIVHTGGRRDEWRDGFGETDIHFFGQTQITDPRRVLSNGANAVTTYETLYYRASLKSPIFLLEIWR